MCNRLPPARMNGTDGLSQILLLTCLCLASCSQLFLLADCILIGTRTRTLAMTARAVYSGQDQHRDRQLASFLFRAPGHVMNIRVSLSSRINYVLFLLSSKQDGALHYTHCKLRLSSQP